MEGLPALVDSVAATLGPDRRGVRGAWRGSLGDHPCSGAGPAGPRDAGRSAGNRSWQPRRPAQAASAAATLEGYPALSSVPILCPLPPTAPSGQPEARPHFGTPLCGQPERLGAHIDPTTGNTNFAVYSSGATAVWLVLFTEGDLKQGRTTVEVPLDMQKNRTGDIWHIALPCLDPKLLYGFRMDGPSQDADDSAPGHRFDKACVLLDPYAQGILGRREYGKLGNDLAYNSNGILGHGATWPQAGCCLPQPNDAFDWEGDKPLNIPLEDLVIYEMHVRGFTMDPSSNVKTPGTFEALTEKLDYLQHLGINCIELLPVHEFNELEYYEVDAQTDFQKLNYWGYSTVGYFSPMARYSASVARGEGGQEMLNEFRHLVKSCHQRGIEVLLDVVFNHSAEGNHLGPTLSFRGLDNRVYYMLAPGGEYYNYSGCGNTINCNHPVVRHFIVDCLKFWVQEMHVDGFRFDLASIMTRAHSAWELGEVGPTGVQELPHSGGDMSNGNGHIPDGAGAPTGTPLSDPAVIELISEDPVLRHTKLIAEAWDADGLNQVGAFPHYGGRWAEWNGTFRDTVRNFIKGTDGPWAGEFASAICGSPHLYQDTEPKDNSWWRQNDGRKWCGRRGPMHSVNFVTAHDGFTLADLVMFSKKHNDANGEGNNDGEEHNCSWNCGVEGPTDDIVISRLRERQMCNMMCALMLSHGVPMLVMGDEYGQSKDGNNNTYCHDSEINWFNWDKAGKQNGKLLRFVRQLALLRHRRPELRIGLHNGNGNIDWHGDVPDEPDWSESSRMVAFTISGTQGQGLYVAFNAAHVPRIVTLPKWPGCRWELLVDTSVPAPFNFLFPDDLMSPEDVTVGKASKADWLAEGSYPLMQYSCIVLESVPDGFPYDSDEERKE